LEMEFILLVELHEEFRVSRIHASFDAIVYQLIIATGLCIFVGILTYTTESEERTETQGSSRMGVNQCVTNQNSVFMMNEQGFFLQDYTTYTIQGCRHIFTFIFTNVLVASGGVVISLILVKAQIELGTMLNHRCVQRRKQHVVFIIQFWDGDNKQSMVLSCVTINDGGTMVSS